LNKASVETASCVECAVMAEEEMVWDLSQLARAPYVYAQLFVHALYQLYREQGESFVPKLKRLLALRGSKSPQELAAELGFDITEEAFWQKGMKQAEQFVNMLEETLAN